MSEVVLDSTRARAPRDWGVSAESVEFYIPPAIGSLQVAPTSPRTHSNPAQQRVSSQTAPALAH